MKTNILKLLIIVVPISFLYSQSKTPCEKWNEERSKIVSLDDQLEFYRKALLKVDNNCKIEILINIGDIYSDNMNKDSSIYYFDKAIELAHIEKKEELLAKSYSTKARCLIDFLNIKEAEELLLKAKRILKKFPNSEKKVSYYSAMSFLEDSKTNFSEAIKYCDSNIILANKNKLDNVIPDNYHNKGTYYLSLTNYEKATENLLLALKLKEKNKENDIGNTYFVLGVCYERWEFYEIAIKYLKKAVESSIKNKNYNVALRSYVIMSKTNRGLNNFEESKKCIDSALILAKKLDLKDQYAESITEKGWLFLENFKDTVNAEKFYLEGYDNAIKSKNESTIFYNLQSLLLLYYNKKEFNKATPYMKRFEVAADACNTTIHTSLKHKFFYRYYDGLGEYKKALDHFKDLFWLEDSIKNATINTRVADLEKKYDTQKKELEIVNLGKEKSAQKLLIEKAEFKQNLFLVLALLLVVLLLIGYWIYKKIRLQKEALAKAHNELALSNEKLTEIDIVKNRLFSIIAHDLRSMLIPFQRSGKLLKYFIDNKEEKQAIQLSKELENNSYSLSNMLDNLLNWSLDQMNGYTYNPSVISVKNELEEILLVYKQQATYKNTDLTLKYDEDISILFDKGAFHVIFRNLISNALKYTENGSVRISFVIDFNSFKCTIVDTGVGMTKDQVENVFQLEENKTTIGTQGEKGTGIGLNLVYRFVKMHKGNIIVSSEKRIGTQFELIFPITDSKEQNDTFNAESKSA